MQQIHILSHMFELCRSIALQFHPIAFCLHGNNGLLKAEIKSSFSIEVERDAERDRKWHILAIVQIDFLANADDNVTLVRPFNNIHTFNK